MFDRLQDKFSKIFSAIKGHGKISEKNVSEAIREIRIALLESDKITSSNPAGKNENNDGWILRIE